MLRFIALRHVGSSWKRDWTYVPQLPGGFSTTGPPGKSQRDLLWKVSLRDHGSWHVPRSAVSKSKNQKNYRHSASSKADKTETREALMFFNLSKQVKVSVHPTWWRNPFCSQQGWPFCAIRAFLIGWGPTWLGRAIWCTQSSQSHPETPSIICD